ncbi:MAG: 2-methylisocitrate lyase-like PEP mutase family enzyme [Candidatus Azotimanducaceae bacterium]|jgi:2-methylisocitrate lyase-like PEP mutase family enzyme
MGIQDPDATIRKLQAFEAAGASALYAPGLNNLRQLVDVTSAIGKPFNVLAPFFSNTSLDDFAQAGAKQISLGAAFIYAAINPLLSASKEMSSQCTFN